MKKCPAAAIWNSVKNKKPVVTRRALRGVTPASPDDFQGTIPFAYLLKEIILFG